MGGPWNPTHDTYEGLGWKKHHHLWVDFELQCIIRQVPHVVKFRKKQPTFSTRGIQRSPHPIWMKPHIALKMFESKLVKCNSLIVCKDQLARIHQSQHHHVCKHTGRHDLVCLCCPWALRKLASPGSKPKCQNLRRSCFALKTRETYSFRDCRIKPIPNWGFKRLNHVHWKRCNQLHPRQGTGSKSSVQPWWGESGLRALLLVGFLPQEKIPVSPS